MAYLRISLCMSQTQESRTAVQVWIPFIRKFPGLMHQENFSKGSTRDKIPVRHLAEGCAEGAGVEAPFAVFLVYQTK